MTEESNPLAGLGGPRPLDGALTARIEDALGSLRDPVAAVLSGIDAPRPLPGYLREGLLTRLRGPRLWRTAPALVGVVAAALLLLAGLDLGLRSGPAPPRTQIAQGSAGGTATGSAGGSGAAGSVGGGAAGGGAFATGTSGSGAGTSGVAGGATGSPEAPGASSSGAPGVGAGGSSAGGGSAPPPSTESPPQVKGVVPNTGPTTGGLWIDVTGIGFHDAGSVRFGATPATRIMVISDTELLAQSPAHPPGRVDVAVVGPGGPSRNTPADYFTYSG